ncbi:MAG: hypothetical protein LC104_14265 [Bacteroidales bacterium]|nr:hypothetical protein [Bacteroidales bacterium]
MSIPVLTQVYQEARRLAVAGSVVAHGDFRLKKLLPALDQAGAKAPVFAKVAESARAVIEGPEEKASESLLELTSLVTAVLYTQGETGCPGPLEPITSIALGGSANISARLLKEVLEALTNTGSGRLEQVKDAHERGLFRDLRLVRAAVNGLDDPYAEIAEFLADHVLPLYGSAVLPDVRAQYDPKGTKGHPRRLRLLHKLDPVGARELVLQALESGSKEVKVAAIGCLGAADLPFLLEQASAKAQDVRAAAYQALAGVDHPDAVAAISKAIAGKDIEIVTDAISESTGNSRLATLVAAQIETERDTLLSLRDKKKVSVCANRLRFLVRSVSRWEFPGTDAILLDLFHRRDELTKIKGEHQSGADVAEAVVTQMRLGSTALQQTLARSHAQLDAQHLDEAVRAGRLSLATSEFYEQFAPYLEAPLAGKKKGKDPTSEKRDAVIQGLEARYIYYYRGDRHETIPPLDPRWSDLAVRIKNLPLIHAAPPGQAGTEAYLWQEFESAMQKPKLPDEHYQLLTVIVDHQHPRATDAVIATIEKIAGKKNQNTYTYWFYSIIQRLPKDAIPRLEALVPQLKGADADMLINAIENLRENH